MTDRVTEVAFGIYQEFTRERDPERARARFEKLPNTTRRQFEREAKAAIRIADATRDGDFL